MSHFWRSLLLTYFSLLLFTLNCSHIKTLSSADRLTPDEKLEYLLLTVIDARAAREFLSFSTPLARSEYRQWFWKQKSQEERHRLLMRAKKARELFGKIDLLGDERVLTYIRYGPARREEYILQSVQPETSSLSVNPAEIWTYDSLGFQIDFVRKGTAFKKVGISRFGNRWFPPTLEAVDYGKPPPSPGPTTTPLNFAYRIYRLGQNNDSVTVELHYGIATTNPGIIPDQQNLIYIAFNFQSRKYGTFTRTGWFGFTPETTTAWVVGRQTLLLPADVYLISVIAVTRNGTARYYQRSELNLIDYIRRSQPCSDILFYSLIDSCYQTPQFERLDWRRVIPLVPPEIPAGGTAYILYELYQIATDTLNQYQLETTYELMATATRQLAVIPNPSRSVTGSGPTAVMVERIHTMDLKPGRYQLLARIKDVIGKRTISLTADFTILSPAKTERLR